MEKKQNMEDRRKLGMIQYEYDKHLKGRPLLNRSESSLYSKHGICL